MDEREESVGWVGGVLLLVVGCVSVSLLGSGAPSAPGAARIASPEILLAAHDTLWVLVVGVVAVREIQDSDWMGAALSTIPGWILGFLVLPVAFLGSLTRGG